jgi:hypothetical protein
MGTMIVLFRWTLTHNGACESWRCLARSALGCAQVCRGGCNGTLTADTSAALASHRTLEIFARVQLQSKLLIRKLRQLALECGTVPFESWNDQLSRLVC